MGRVETLSCRLNAADVAYRVYLRRTGSTLYVAEGLGGYDSALRLALRSLVADREVQGEVSIATTGAGDPAAFARVQAGTLDPQRALAEAYRRNNAGSYAESAEFFAALIQGDSAAVNQAEALVNEALQKSNLGRYGEADFLFARAMGMAGADPVTARRVRNYRTMHLLNQGLTAEALTELNRPMPPIGIDAAVRDLVIDRPTAGRLSAESPGASRLRGQEGLTQDDKAQILDGQALQLRGVVLRLQHRDADAVAPFTQALGQLVAIRGGRIAATIWLRAQVLGDLAGIAEGRGDRAEAERLHLAAVALLEGDYPGSAALLAPRAGSPVSMRAPGGSSRRSPSIATSSRPMPKAATARRGCGGRSSPISRFRPPGATTRRRSPTCSRRARCWSGPASPRPRRCLPASFRAAATRRPACFASRST